MAISCKANVHIEILVGTFLVGTLAFIVANAWNNFMELILSDLEIEENASDERGKGGIKYNAIYVAIVTCFSVGILAILIHFEIIRHSGHSTG